MDTGACQATVHGVLKSQDLLKEGTCEKLYDFIFFFFLSINEFSKQSRNLSILSSFKVRRFHTYFPQEL